MKESEIDKKITELEAERVKLMAETHTHSEWVKMMGHRMAKLYSQLRMLKDGVSG